MVQAVRFEVEAQDMLLKIARDKGWTRAEIEFLKRNKAAWIEKANEYRRRFPEVFDELEERFPL